MVAAFMGGQGSKAGVCFAQNQRDELRDLGEKTGALAAEQGMHQQNFIVLKCLNPWDCQSKRIYQPDGVYPTLPAMDCGGMNNQAVLYALDSMSSNSMKSSNPHSGFHAETIAKTLQAGGVDPTCNQGGNVIVEPVYALQDNGIDRALTAGCNGAGWRQDALYTLNTIDRHAVAYRQGGFGDYVEGECGTLKASGGDFGGGSENLIIENTIRYIVRRLTPTECARLQGFPDKWGHPDYKDSFTDKEYRFWLGVRNTHAEINGKAVKDYTRDQMLTWYNKLHTDSAEYKMWGNGIALPPALYCMQGIQDELERMETKKC